MNAVELQSYISDAYRAGRKRVVIPRGEYRLARLPDGEACLFFKGLEDFEIDATDVTFLICGNAQSIRLERCRNVTLKGGVFRHEIPPFSQGRIEHIDQGRKWLDVRIDKGYLQDIDNPQYFFRPGTPKFVNIFDPNTRELKPGLDDLFFIEVQRIEAGLFRFIFAKPLSQRFQIREGDLAGWRGVVAPDLFFIECEGLQLTDVVIQSGSGFVIYEAGGNGGNVYRRCRIERGPAPKGGTERPLFSANADGFHSVSVRRGPQLVDCRFEHMNDDCVAIHGVSYLVLEAEDRTLTVATAPQSHPYYSEAGDTLRIYDENGASVDEGKITSITPMPGYKITQDLGPFSQYENERKSGTLRVYKVVLDKAFPARFPWFAVNADTQGSGFAIRNCRVGFNRPRGMLIQAGDGIIEGCTVEGSAIGGIIVAPDMHFWAEGDYARNLTIRDNVFRNVGIWTQIGAVNISCWWGRGYDRFTPSGGHQNVTISGNIFEKNDGLNVLVSSATNVSIINNRFVSPGRNLEPYPFNAPEGALGWIVNSRDVTVEGNAIIDPGTHLKSGFVFSPPPVNPPMNHEQ